jgi:RNA polymerase sigma-70 factor (ECF subfamily)
MGRHAADSTAPGSPDPDRRGRAAGRQAPRHADLFGPRPDAATGVTAERAARAFDRLVEPHRAALRAYVLRVTDGDDALAESIVKETLYRAAQEPGRYARSRWAVRPWLLLTVRSVLRDGERYAPAGHDDRPVPSPPRQARPPGPVAIPTTTIAAAMADLSIIDRELIIELFHGGVSLEAAATARGVSVPQIKSRLYDAMRALRAVLDQQVADRYDTR